MNFYCVICVDIRLDVADLHLSDDHRAVSVAERLVNMAGTGVRLA